MQLNHYGPDIPDELLQAHEQGTVVFFCGAGISCPAGLPLFRKQQLYASKYAGFAVTTVLHNTTAR
jgi:NAD-dependent SIR2 family protein deacetylase